MGRLIGLTGKAGCGKDTIADELQERGWWKVAFADALKEILMTYGGLTWDDLNTQEGKERYQEGYGMTTREIMQKFGTDAIRDHFSKDFWVNATKSDIEYLLEKENADVVITDVRFDNEAKMIHDMGGKIFMISRDYESALSESERNHESEQGIDLHLVDYPLYSNGTPRFIAESIVATYSKVKSIRECGGEE